MASKELWKTLLPPPEPPVAEVLNLWRMQFNTADIARMLGVRESVIYNMLARLSK